LPVPENVDVHPRGSEGNPIMGKVVEGIGFEDYASSGIYSKVAG
jgi:hypothetical protein